MQKKLEKEGYFSLKTKKDHLLILKNILYFYNAKYLISGLKSLRKVEDNSINYIFSHSVIEHVRKSQLNDLINEMFRVLK